MMTQRMMMMMMINTAMNKIRTNQNIYEINEKEKAGKRERKRLKEKSFW